VSNLGGHWPIIDAYSFVVDVSVSKPERLNGNCGRTSRPNFTLFTHPVIIGDGRNVCYFVVRDQVSNLWYTLDGLGDQSPCGRRFRFSKV